MTQRINYQKLAQPLFRKLFEMSQQVKESGLGDKLIDLVDIRASQLNGCAFCIDMHWLDAKAGGEEDARLYGLDAWRESPLYEERERAALALCEAVTQIDRAGVPDEVWTEAQEHFDEDELAHLLCAIAATNTWNRLQVATRALPGNYAPADREAVGGAAAGTTDDGAAAAGAAADAAAAGAGR